MKSVRESNDVELPTKLQCIEEGKVKLDWLSFAVRNNKGETLLRIEEGDVYYKKILQTIDTLLLMMKGTNTAIQSGAVFINKLEEHSSDETPLLEETKAKMNESIFEQMKRQDEFMVQESIPILFHHWKKIAAHPSCPAHTED